MVVLRREMLLYLECLVKHRLGIVVGLLGALVCRHSLYVLELLVETAREEGEALPAARMCERLSEGLNRSPGRPSRCGPQ